jgi:cation diffusion facilitator CzcD-associated flavoprotein CzcO
MAGLDGDGYEGSAVLEVDGSRFDVQVRLRGHFQPIDGRYHWYGRVGAHDGLDELLGSAKANGVLVTPEGSAPCELSEPDPSRRYRVTGISTPPFRTGNAGPGPAGRGGTAETAGLGGTGGPATAGLGGTGGPATAGLEAAGLGAAGLGTAVPGGATAPAGTAAGPGAPLPGHVRAAIVGAGLGGIGAGIRLRQAGVTDFVILERAAAVGGTWRDNTYPGCACDVPSHLYSFSFAPNPDWSHSFSRQPEIWRYTEDVTDQYGLRGHLAFGTDLIRADWDADSARWRLQTSRGDLTADVLVCAAGPLSEPSLPDVPGLADFAGPVFHSARWNHDYGLEGKRVAVVGTGASAIQIVPKIQPEVKRLVLFQRTPAWIVPRRDRRITAFEKRLYRQVPAAQRLARLGVYVSRESLVGGFTKRPAILKAAQRMALRHLARSIPDPELRAKLTPDYVMGCKRILISSDFYPALRRPNVQVVASGLGKVDGNTLTAKDGTSCEVDAIILATGFHAVDAPIAGRLFGADGASLAQAWNGDMRALRGTTIAGFPNMCMVIGPNTGLGHNSMIYMIESQLNYIVDYLATLDRTGAAALDTRPGAQQGWCDDVERRMASTVWTTGGCVSWYLNAAGRNPTLWPGSTLGFRRATRQLDPAEYELIPHRAG